MFINFEMFKIYMRRVFKDIDAERTVARELMNLEQKRVTSMYVIWFQRVLFNLS